MKSRRIKKSLLRLSQNPPDNTLNSNAVSKVAGGFDTWATEGTGG
jgi:hypothetical protein